MDSVDQNKFAFIMNIAQYTLQDPSGSFPLHAFILEQCKWRDQSKAMLSVKSIVALTGVLSVVPLGKGPPQVMFQVSVAHHLDFMDHSAMPLVAMTRSENSFCFIA
jgi:hypothetical protein